MNSPTPHCEFCGAPLPIGARFCEACGQPVKNAPPAVPPPSYQASLPVTPPLPSYQASLPSTPPPAPVVPPPVPARPMQSQPFTLPPTPAAPLITEKPKNKWILPACLGGGGCLLVLCLVTIAILYFFFSSAEWDAVLETVMPAVLETQEAAVATVVQEEFVPATLPAGIITATAVPLPNGQTAPTKAPLATEAPQVDVSAAIWPADIGQKQTDTYFSDDFSAPAFVEWDGGEAGKSTFEIIDGRYQGFLFVPDYISWVYLPLEFTPTTIGFDAAIVPGFEQGGYGVLCHHLDDNHFHFVSLDPWYHEYSIGYFEDGEFYELMQDMWLESTTLLDDPYAVNHIEVVCDPDQITLFVNNQLEAQVEITVTEGGQTGIYVETWTDTPAEGFKALFDNLYAYIPVQ